MAKIGLNGPMTNRVKVIKYSLGLLIGTNNFAFGFKAILGLESTHLEIRVAEVGLNGPHD